MKKKNILSTVAVLSMLISSPAYASELNQEGTSNALEETSVPVISIDDINESNEFIFNEDFKQVRLTSSPNKEWSSSNAYSVSGNSSSGSTLYTNYYFSSIVGKTFNFTAGKANRLKVDLVHRGSVIQKVVSTWTIDVGKSKKYTIVTGDLDGYSNSDNYYFRFNSDPIGHSYSVSGTFGK